MYAGRTEDFALPHDCRVMDAEGLYVSAGLMDIHVHGGGEYRFFERPLYCAKWVAARGTTAILPTNGTSQTLEELIHSGNEIKELQKYLIGRCMKGIYMEGPYMNGVGGHMSSCKWGGPIDSRQYIPLVDSLKISPVSGPWTRTGRGSRNS